MTPSDIYIHVDHNNGQFVIRKRKEIEGFTSLSEENKDPCWVKDSYLYGASFDTEIAIRDKLIQLTFPETQQWSLTEAAKQRIQEIILFNLESEE